MHLALLAKAIVTGILAILLIVPLVMIVGLVHDRQAASQQVLADVQQAGVGAQVLTGPILVVPYRRSTSTEISNPPSGAKSVVTTHDEGRLYFLPDTLAAEVEVSTETRYRGIYSALLFNAQHAIRGTFAVPERFGVAESASVTYEFENAYVILEI